MRAAIAEQLESAKRNFEVGTSTVTDSREAQARYDLVRKWDALAEYRWLRVDENDSDKRDSHDDDQDEDKADTTTTMQRATHQL